MDERLMLLNKISELDFASFDLHLFLNTHPNNMEVSKKLDEYRYKSSMLKKEYESRFGPLSMSDKNGNRWAWISNPWPWESIYEEDC